MGVEDTEPDYITGVCPSCHQAGLFRFVGRQDIQDNESYRLYSCFTCDSTVSDKRIEQVRVFK